MNGTGLKTIFIFKIVEYGNKNKLYYISCRLNAANVNTLVNMLKIDRCEFLKQVDEYNGVEMEGKLLFLNREDAEKFIAWLDSLVTMKVLGG